MQNIIKHYEFADETVKVEPFGNGHINKTFLVITEKSKQKYILQQINTNVFKKPVEVMENIELITNHIREFAAAEAEDPSRAALEIVRTITNKTFMRIDTMFWRCYKYVEGAKTYEIIENPDMFYEVGKAIGIFQRQLSKFPISKLNITIPDFHNTPVRFAKFVNVSNTDPHQRGIEVFNEVKFVFDRKKGMSKIVDLMRDKKIPVRVTHNDTKLNNVMIDEITNKAICVIDLDTVMPGSVLYDFGDAIRVGASTAMEDEKDLSKVNLDIELFEKFTRGFLEKTYDILTVTEIENLVEGARIITLECGMRFLTDFLENDIYFQVNYPYHNLVRARTQFKLVEEIEKNYDKLDNIVKSIIKDLK